MRWKESAYVQIRWCFGWRAVTWSPQMWGAFTWSSLMWFQLVVVWTEKKSSCVVHVFEWGTKKSLEFSVPCLPKMFFAVKSWNFVGLICLCLLEGILRTVQLAWLVPAPQPPYKRKRHCCLHRSCRVGRSSLWNILVMQPGSLEW